MKEKLQVSPSEDEIETLRNIIEAGNREEIAEQKIIGKKAPAKKKVKHHHSSKPAEATGDTR